METLNNELAFHSDVLHCELITGLLPRENIDGGFVCVQLKCSEHLVVMDIVVKLGCPQYCGKQQRHSVSHLP